jgi:hypothetical protein
VLLAVLAAATALPLLFVRYLPFTDLPEHVAAIATMARLLPGGGGAPEYVLSLGQSQYLLYDLAGAVLTRIIGDAVLANRLLLAAVALLWPFAFRSLLRALGRDERLAVFACTVFWNRALTIGFLPFVASVPLAVYALSVLVEQLERPTPKRSALLAGVALALFYTHVSSYVLFGFAGGVMTVFQAALTRTLTRRVRLAAWGLLPLVPSAIAALVWWQAGSLDAHVGERSHVGHLPVGVALDAAPIWAFDIWRSHGDEVWSSLWWVAFGLVVATGLRRRPDRADVVRGLFALVPLACALAVYVFTPFHVGLAGYLDVRLAPLLALFALLILRPAGGRWGRIQLGIASAAALGTALTAGFEMARVEREMVSGLDALLATMKPNTKLAMLNFEQRSSRTYFWPYVLVGSYHRQKAGAIASYSFTELAHWPIHYAAGGAPPVHRPLWSYHPCEFQHRADGTYYDYVLVQGQKDPFDGDHPGPEFRAVARAGVFTLFAKSSGDDQSPGVPDRSPCRLIGPPPAPSGR